MSTGALKVPRRRKSMFSEAAESEGTNQVTTTTDAMLKSRISAVRKAGDLA